MEISAAKFCGGVPIAKGIPLLITESSSVTFWMGNKTTGVFVVSHEAWEYTSGDLASRT